MTGVAPAIPRNSLLRILGVGFGVAVVVGGAVGQGILRTPGIVAGQLELPWLILAAWTVGGLIALIDSFAVAELATSVPKAGGPYSYASRAFGPLGGTLVGWSDNFANIAAIAFVSWVFGETVQRLGLLQDIPIGAIATLLIAGCWLMTWHGTRSCGWSQNLLNGLKGLGLFALILAFALYGGAAPAAAEAAPDPLLTAGALAISFRAIQTTYSGWHSAVYFSEEMTDPGRNLPRALFVGVALIGLLYVLTNAALLAVLPVPAIAASTFPAADAADIVFGPLGGTILALFAILSFVAITQLNLMTAPRVAYAMAREGHLPALFGRVAEKGTPRTALLATALVSALLLLSGGYETLLAYSVAFTSVNYAAMDLCAIRLRLKEPDLPRPFRMPLFPLPAMLGLLVNLALLAAFIWEDPVASLSGLGAVLALGLWHWWRHRART